MNPHPSDGALPTISISELSAVAGGKDKNKPVADSNVNTVKDEGRIKVDFEVPGVPFVMWHGDPGNMGRDEKRSFCAYGRPFHRECRGIWDEK